ncbi:MAG: hypothetical protein U1A27_13460 [Phycisphaerae bacterium]
MRGRISAIVRALPWLLAARAAASPVSLQVVPAQSNISTTLCMTICGMQCSTSGSPVSGAIVVGLDCLTQPQNIILHDFSFLLNNSIQWHLNFGIICGRFDSTATSVGLHYGTPGTPMPPAPLVGGAFDYAAVPSTMTGVLSYTSTNLVCAAFQAAGRLCSDTIDLGTLAPGSVTLNGTAQVSGRNVTLTLSVNSSGPIDPANPGLGSLTIVGTVVATGTVPLPDAATFLAVLLGEVTAQDAVCESDINLDGDDDGRDVQAYVDALLGP